MQKKRKYLGDEALAGILSLLRREQERLRLSDSELAQLITDHAPGFVPLTILTDRTLGALEAIVVHLKDSHNLTYHKIAQLLNRNDRTIWTTYSKAKAKLAKAN